jgi:ABC-type polysaccharide/polyol phosphate export permease
MNPAYIRIAVNDIARSLKEIQLAAFLAWEDIRQRYVRTMLGPLWIVLSTGVWFFVMGFVMANLFGRELSDYLPYVFSGLLVWVLISTSVMESSRVLVDSAPLITSFAIPIFIHYIRFVLRNYIIFLHNILILAIVMIIFPPHVTAATWLVIPGLLLDMAILMSLAVFLSLANLRYRDTHLAVASAMQVLPFVTPIFWNRDMLKQHQWIADFNPFYHMIEIARQPMLGQEPGMLSWMVTGGMAIVLFITACALFVRYRHRIIFWL